jgi:hypothetical protein
MTAELRFDCPVISEWLGARATHCLRATPLRLPIVYYGSFFIQIRSGSRRNRGVGCIRLIAFLALPGLHLPDFVVSRCELGALTDRGKAIFRFIDYVC